MSLFQKDYYVVRGRRSFPVRLERGYTPLALAHSPFRGGRSATLSPPGRVSGLDRGRRPLPAREEERTRSLSLDDLYCCDDAECILPSKLHDDLEYHLDRQRRRSTPTSKLRESVLLCETPELSLYRSSRRPLQSPARASRSTNLYSIESRLPSYEPPAASIRFPTYERKRRLSSSPSPARDYIGSSSRSDAKKAQYTGHRPNNHSSSSPTCYSVVAPTVQRTGYESPDIRISRATDSTTRVPPRIIPRGGGATAVRSDLFLETDENPKRLSSKQPITRITIPAATSTRQHSRPVFREVKNQAKPRPESAKPVKQVRFTDDEPESEQSEPEPMVTTSDFSTSLVVKKKKPPGFSSPSNAAYQAARKSNKRPEIGGSTLRGDPILRRRRIE